ncbi:Unannotated [Lentimonas sp. CC19]|nr:Unannotated [Lentimonas sp. CC4]CAA6687527.1 Unannotated [Lentimonas sp. CC6]CAA6691668.1 Unannotated [Lentimonas sp. CC19]CAA6692267.1 Unannotated [Lentimonas sp. CC10]CAA7070208.1 Unannotated [Lentimonas sp. CC11]CAA7171902.1 Unannotated [Lentimonas sp. CC21]CAA7181892.1 Unannotated [Lentimonas sp. CC8]
MGKLILVWIVALFLSLVFFENLWIFFIVFSSVTLIPFIHEASEDYNFNLYDHIGKGGRKRRKYLKEHKERRK